MSKIPVKRVFPGSNLHALIAFTVVLVVLELGWCLYDQKLSHLLDPLFHLEFFAISVFISLIISSVASFMIIPFVKSYAMEKDASRFTPGGFNLYVRIGYLSLSLLCYGLVYYFNGKSIDDEASYGLFDFIQIGFGLLIVSGIILKYYSNRKDYLTVSSNEINWYDNDAKGSKAVSTNSILEVKKIIERSSRDKTVELGVKSLLLKTESEEHKINIDDMSLTPYAEIILEKIESCTGKTALKVLE